MAHTISFKYAAQGILHTFKTQPNLRIHLSIALLVLVTAAALHVPLSDWVILLFTIMWVVTAEMLNTAIEAVVDLITTEYHLQAKIAKDVSAGMVLVGALGAVVVGVVIFTPYLIALL